MMNQEVFDMMNQEVFDKVVTHLYSMKRPSRHALGDGVNACAYRGANGARCAIGVLIPDDLYTADMEGLSADRLFLKFKRVAELYGDISLGLLRDLQLIHDYEPNWNCADEGGLNKNYLRHELTMIAKRYRLNINVLPPEDFDDGQEDKPSS